MSTRFYGPFVRGAMWQSFLAKYPEANQIHKKMLYVSSRLQTAMDEAIKKGGDDGIRGEAANLLGTAQRELYRGQCCCAYWHGLFGGLYLNYLRHALYESLLKAEVILDRLQQGTSDWVAYEEEDVDLDGRQEVVLSNRSLNAYVAPHRGAALFELDWKPSHFNLTNVLTRCEEGYHRFAKGSHDTSGGGTPKTIHDGVRVKETGLERYLVYDDVPRWSLIDRFFSPDLTLDGFKNRTAKDRGDFAAGDFSVVEVGVDERGKTGATLIVERTGRVAEQPVRVRKSYLLAMDGGDLGVRWEITNLGESPLSVAFGSELNFSLLAGNDPSRYVRINGGDTQHALETEGVTERFERAELVDQWAKLRLTLEAKGGPRMLRHAIETVSQSESGLERTYQGTCFFPLWSLELPPNQTKTVELRLIAGAL